ncbi:hypothetical protein SLEP1_g618 [Rubroshorea leprosula]|uniref:Uncharacterized protein n=1 Tax=Rubroshorea leprosula TaxID=152421 RepID=A0AAV5HM05_9ROSI|nr:hypothetical protein SLEP1_g618 [Rubroshorea leprosula]
MYADRVEAGSKLSIRERLNVKSSADPLSRRQVSGRRQRQDDKWEHDLYDDDEPQVSRRNVDPRDLRLKLQRKSFKQVSQSGKRGVRDLREMLSGTMNSQPVNVDPPKPKLEAAKPARKSVVVEASEQEPKRTATAAVRKSAQEKVCIF